MNTAPGSAPLVCPVCGAEWTLTADERLWFESRKLHLPRRCHRCRDSERRHAEDLRTEIEMNQLQKQTGTLRTWDARRGFGFIIPDNGVASGDVFAHISAVCAPKNLRAGARVEFFVVASDRAPGKTCAAQVRVLAEGT
jgi:cold shock CspA family protein